MQCLGRNRDFRRCKNNAKHLVCSRHTWQIFIFIIVTVPGTIATYIAVGASVHKLWYDWKNKEEMSIIESLGYIDSSVVAIYPMNLASQAGTIFEFGNCPRTPCFKFHYLGIGDVEGLKVANLGVGGEWEGMKADNIDSYIIGLPIKKGGSILLTSYTYDLMLVIMDDRISSLKATIIVLKGTNSRKSGFDIRPVKRR